MTAARSCRVVAVIMPATGLTSWRCQPGIAAVLDSWIAQRGERPATPRLAPPWLSVRAV
jgi:hypothetical protein